MSTQKTQGTTATTPISRLQTYLWDKSIPVLSARGIGSEEELKVRALLSPLLRLAQDAKFCPSACLHLFDLCALVCEEALTHNNFDERQTAIEDMIWQVSAFVGSFSGPDWVASLRQSAQSIESAYEEQVASIRVASGGGLSIRSPMALQNEIHNKVVEEIDLMTSLLASYGGLESLASFGSLQRQAAFTKELIPLLHCSHTANNQVALPDEISFGLMKFGATHCLGPHSSLRHPALRLLWWQKARGKESLPWAELFKLLEVSAGWQSRYKDPNDLSGDTQKIGSPADLRALLAEPSARSWIEAAIESKAPWMTVAGSGYCSPQLLDVSIDPTRTLVEEFVRLKLTAPATPSSIPSISSPAKRTARFEIEEEEEDQLPWQSFLVGRDQTIKDLWERVSLSRSVPLVSVLYGKQGVGKTAMAEALAHRGVSGRLWSNGIHFASLAACSSFESGSLAIATAFNVPLHFTEPPLSPSERLKCYFLWKGTLKPGREILILDDVDEMLPSKDLGSQDGLEIQQDSMSHLWQLLQLLLSTAPFLDIILTSRSSYSIEDYEPPTAAFQLGLIQDLGSTTPPPLPFKIESHQIKPLDYQSSLELFAMHSGPLQTSTAERLVAQSQGIPSIIKLLGCLAGKKTHMDKLMAGTSSSSQGSIASIIPALLPILFTKLGRGPTSLLILLSLFGTPVSDEELLLLLTTAEKEGLNKEAADRPSPLHSSTIAIEMCTLYDFGLLSFSTLGGKHKLDSHILCELRAALRACRADGAVGHLSEDVIHSSSSRLLTAVSSLGSLLDSLWRAVEGGVVYSLGGDCPIAPLPSALLQFGRRQGLIHCVIRAAKEWTTLFPPLLTNDTSHLILDSFFLIARRHLNRLCRLMMDSHHLAFFSQAVGQLASFGHAKDKTSLLIASRGLSAANHGFQAQNLLDLALETNGGEAAETNQEDPDQLPYEAHLLLARAEAAAAIGSSPEAVLLLKRFARFEGAELSPGALFDQCQGLKLLSDLLMDVSKAPPGIAPEKSYREPPGRLSRGGMVSPESSYMSAKSMSRPNSSNSSAALTFLAALVTKLEKWSSFSFPPNRPESIHPLLARAQIWLVSCRLNCGLTSEAEERADLALNSIQGAMGRMSLDAAIGARELALARLDIVGSPNVEGVIAQLALSLQVMLRIVPMSHPEVASTLQALKDASDLSSRSTEIKELVDEQHLSGKRTPVDLSLALLRLFPEGAAQSLSPRLGLISPTGSHQQRPGSSARLPPLDGSYTARNVLDEGVVLSGGSFSRLRLRDALMASRTNSETSSVGVAARSPLPSRSITTGGKAAVSSNPLFDRNSVKN